MSWMTTLKNGASVRCLKSFDSLKTDRRVDAITGLNGSHGYEHKEEEEFPRCSVIFD